MWWSSPNVHVGQRLFGCLQDFEEVLADQVLQFGRITHKLAVHPLANALQDFGGRPWPNVGCDERILQLVQQVCVDLLAPGEEILDTIHESGTGLFDAGL